MQIGTSMASTRLVEGWEAELGVPVLAVNAVCFWHALRLSGIEDRLEGVGRLPRTA